MASRKATALARVRKLCLSFDDTSERPSHGAPTFFVAGKRAFVMFVDDHHGDGRLARPRRRLVGGRRGHRARIPDPRPFACAQTAVG